MYQPFIVGNTVIETERLRLRGWRNTEQDIADMYDYARYEKVGRPAGWKYHTSMDESREIVQMFVKEDNCFAITDKENGKVIGSVGLHQPKELDGYEQLQGLEIGYVLHPDYWGKGMMPEAVKGVIDWIFSHTPVEILFCGHYTFNDRSRRVIEKCGFTCCLLLTDQQTAAGDRVDEKLYRLLKSEWNHK
jgi:RimJ/RimL family protein N-acetyltransferase